MLPTWVRTKVLLLWTQGRDRAGAAEVEDSQPERSECPSSAWCQRCARLGESVCLRLHSQPGKPVGESTPRRWQELPGTWIRKEAERQSFEPLHSGPLCGDGEAHRKRFVSGSTFWGGGPRMDTGVCPLPHAVVGACEGGCRCGPRPRLGSDKN